MGNVSIRFEKQLGQDDEEVRRQNNSNSLICPYVIFPWDCLNYLTSSGLVNFLCKSKGEQTFIYRVKLMYSIFEKGTEKLRR